MEKVVITGATGFIGSHLARFLFNNSGAQLLLLSRSPGKIPKDLRSSKRVSTFFFDINKPVQIESLIRADLIIHLAHDFRSDTSDLDLDPNYLSTLKLMEHEPKHFIFVSSMSAIPRATSQYGKIKLHIEKEILARSESVVRPGMVLGHGGLFHRMVEQFKSLPFIPAFYFGNGSIQTIHIDDLCQCILAIGEKELKNKYVLCEKEPHRLKSFYKQVIEAIGLKKTVIPLPGSPFYFGLKLAESLGVRLNFSSDNVLGSKNLTSEPPSETEARLEVKIRDLDESLQSLKNLF